MGFRKTGRPSKKVMSGDLRSEMSFGTTNHSVTSRRKTVRCTELGKQLGDKAVRKDAKLEMKESPRVGRSRNEFKVRFLSTGNVARDVEYSNSTRKKKPDQLRVE